MTADVGFDFKLDRGDLDFSSGGFEFAEGFDAIKQEIENRCYTNRGEWFADLNEGIPLFTRILINTPNEADILEIYREELGAVQGVLLQDKDISITIDNSTVTIDATLETLIGALSLTV